VGLLNSDRCSLPRTKVGKLTVFNIAGNKVRLIAAIHYNTKKVYIRVVLTHAEYNENRWKE
jgi:mRNA interferase HigB